MSVITELADILDLSPIDIESGHERWRLYQRAMEAPSSWRLLAEAVGFEADAAIAMSVVLRMLEKLPAERRAEWIHKLSSEKEMDYASQRSQELQTFVDLSGDELASSSDPLFDPAWSVWLQLRLAESAANEDLLVQLSEEGATKRVRSTATARLRRSRLRP